MVTTTVVGVLSQVKRFRTAARTCLLVPLAVKAIDIAITAAEVYSAAQTGGASAGIVVPAESAAASLVPRGKIVSKIVKSTKEFRGRKFSSKQSRGTQV